MIDLYTAGTANGHRAAIALEESGLAYRVHKLNLQAGDQRKPEYLKINPAGAIPAIVDEDGPGGRPLALAQSGAIVPTSLKNRGSSCPRTRPGGCSRCSG
jgi:GST-like protein